MSKFEHKGIAIELGASGEFFFELDGETITKPSLAAAKKAIDALGKEKAEFKTFDVLVSRRQSEGLVPARVVGLRKQYRGRFSRPDYYFKVQYPSGTIVDETIVYLPGAEADAAREKRAELRASANELERQARALREEADNVVEPFLLYSKEFGRTLEEEKSGKS